MALRIRISPAEHAETAEEEGNNLGLGIKHLKDGCDHPKKAVIQLPQRQDLMVFTSAVSAAAAGKNLFVFE